MGEQDQHGGEDETLRDAEHQAVKGEQPEDANHTGEGSQSAPTQQGEKHQARGAAALRVGCAGNLKEEVAEKEERAEKSGAGVTDVECLCHAGGGAEAVVGAVEIGEAVSDEDRGEEKDPAETQAAAEMHSGCFRAGSVDLFSGHTRVIASSEPVINFPALVRKSITDSQGAGWRGCSLQCLKWKLPT